MGQIEWEVEGEIYSIVHYTLRLMDHEIDGSYLIGSSPEIRTRVYEQIIKHLTKELQEVGDNDGV
jgi:hypothetical protein